MMKEKKTQKYHKADQIIDFDGTYPYSRDDIERSCPEPKSGRWSLPVKMRILSQNKLQLPTKFLSSSPTTAIEP
ncbi:hypothetical protein A0J61_06341 [Choanephora cucurbitarum]|uniref:Uncharacterized protein n=1 Tax=Choanephora cucurbitarum TaxID=101091 RepID=A0A1C7N946_9FUNG|nr:hypothetical protein A0J61_06341 [Choanephora cucurbitarum]